MDWTWLYALTAISIAMACLAHLGGRVLMGMLGADARDPSAGPAGLALIIPLVFIPYGPVQYIVGQRIGYPFNWLQYTGFLILAFGAGIIGLAFDAAAKAEHDAGYTPLSRRILLAALMLVALVPTAVSRTTIPQLVILNILIMGLCINLMLQLGATPGRTTKAALAMILTIAGVTLILHYTPMGSNFRSETVFLFFPLTLTLLALLALELRSSAPMGKTGACMLGALVGLMIIWELRISHLRIMLAILAALNLIGAAASWERIIERFPPFRLIDNLGRRPDAG